METTVKVDEPISSVIKHQLELLKETNIDAIIHKGEMTHDQVILMLKNVNQVICNLKHIIPCLEKIDRVMEGKGWNKS